MKTAILGIVVMVLGGCLVVGYMNRWDDLPRML